MESRKIWPDPSQLKRHMKASLTTSVAYRASNIVLLPAVKFPSPQLLLCPGSCGAEQLLDSALWSEDDGSSVLDVESWSLGGGNRDIMVLHEMEGGRMHFL